MMQSVGSTLLAILAGAAIIALAVIVASTPPGVVYVGGVPGWSTGGPDTLLLTLLSVHKSLASQLSAELLNSLCHANTTPGYVSISAPGWLVEDYSRALEERLNTSLTAERALLTLRGLRLASGGRLAGLYAYYYEEALAETSLALPEYGVRAGFTTRTVVHDAAVFLDETRLAAVIVLVAETATTIHLPQDSVYADRGPIAECLVYSYDASSGRRIASAVVVEEANTTSRIEVAIPLYEATLPGKVNTGLLCRTAKGFFTPVYVSLELKPPLQPP